ncbi:MAG: nitrilase-related carbon-nitrogen hydrolase [Terricaulis sp.]
MLLLGRIVAALISGALLAQAYSLNPFWPLAWIAPIPMLIAAIGASRLGAFAYGAIAGVMSIVLMISYLSDIGGIVTVLIIAVSKALIWGAMAYAVRGASHLLPKWAAVFVFPALMTGIDTLTAAFSPHSTAGALAYSQMDFIPAIQVASLGGVPAITFIVTLFASAIALLIAKRAIVGFLAPALIVTAALAFGYARIAQPLPAGETIDVTLIAGDQFEGVPDDWRAVWNAYTPQIERAADDGRHVIVLPEKIAHLEPGDRAAAIEQLGEIARRRDLLIVAGADDETEEGGRFNRAFVFERTEWHTYDKRHMIPGLESEFQLGTADLEFENGGVLYGVAICKDMDFPDLARGYAGVDVMIVPAWDFDVDAWFHSRMAVLRGVENGYSIIRSARNGVLTVSDGYGRVTSQAPSGPQTAYNVTAPATGLGATLYSRTGDVFGWTMLALAGVLIGWTIWARRRAGQGD